MKFHVLIRLAAAVAVAGLLSACGGSTSDGTGRQPPKSGETGPAFPGSSAPMGGGGNAPR